MKPILSVKHLSSSYSGRKVLHDVTFSIHANEFVSIVGPSGIGKSTLFSILGKTESFDTGTIQLPDEKGIAFMPQGDSLFPWRTVLENIELPTILHPSIQKKTATEMLVHAGLLDYQHAYPKELSVGMKQRVAFIRALMSAHPILCLDEPFSALDEVTRLEMQHWLLSLWSQYPRTILFITHDIEEAIYLSDRILVLSNRPATIVDEIVIPSARPRRKEEMFLRENQQLRERIFKQLYV